jgi:hypothetical protein
MLSSVALVSSSNVQAQRRRVVIVRTSPYRYYRPFGVRSRFNDPFRYRRYDPYSPFDNAYSHYVFRDGESAVNEGYRDGFQTGTDDGKKSKSFNPQRSHYYQEAGFGNFGETYRSGFLRGYQEGYRNGNERAG